MVNPFQCRTRQTDPSTDVVISIDFFGIEKSVNATAIRMPHHNDVVHLKMFYSIFDCRNHRIVLTGRFFIGNNGRNASHNKQVSWLAPQNDGRIRTGIATGDHERFGILSMRELLKKFSVLEQILIAKTVKAGDQFMKIRHKSPRKNKTRRKLSALILLKCRFQYALSASERLIFRLNSHF